MPGATPLGIHQIQSGSVGHGVGPHVVFMIGSLLKARTTQLHNLQCIDIDETGGQRPCVRECCKESITNHIA